jgi:hypothetical protein
MNINLQFVIGVLTLALITILSGTTYYYHGKYEHEVTNYNLVTAKNNELVLNIASDNTAMEKLRADSLARENAANIALAAAEKQLVAYSKQAQDYLTATPTDKNVCISADFLFDNYIKGVK